MHQHIARILAEIAAAEEQHGKHIGRTHTGRLAAPSLPPLPAYVTERLAHGRAAAVEED